jgi:hypothetical protein
MIKGFVNKEFVSKKVFNKIILKTRAKRWAKAEWAHNWQLEARRRATYKYT